MDCTFRIQRWCGTNRCFRQEYLSADPPLWISETDEHGTPVDREVIDAAHRIWKRVLSYVRCQGHDLAPVAEILESACHCVSRAKRRDPERNHIRDLDSYLLWVFVRKYSRRMTREARIHYVESVETIVDGRFDPDHSWVSMLEDKILLEQFLGYPSHDEVLEPWSSLAMTGEARTKWRHEIVKGSVRDLRISVTFRTTATPVPGG